MSAKRITTGDYKRIKRLLRSAQDDKASLWRTKNLIAETMPQEPGLRLNINHVVDRNLSAAELLRLQGVKVRGRK